MSTKTNPENNQTVVPYLILQDAEKFIAFASIVFDAIEVQKVLTDENKIMHAELQIGECKLMLADATAQYQPQPAGLFIYVDDADARYTKALAQGANAVTPLSDQPYGRSGGVADPYGNTWWITSKKMEMHAYPYPVG